MSLGLGGMLKIYVTSSNILFCLWPGLETKKERGERKEERREKHYGCTLSFYNMTTLEIVLAEKMLLDGKGPFAGNVFKNWLEDSVMNSTNLSKCAISKWQTTF